MDTASELSLNRVTSSHHVLEGCQRFWFLTGFEPTVGIDPELVGIDDPQCPLDIGFDFGHTWDAGTVNIVDPEANFLIVARLLKGTDDFAVAP